MKKTIIYGLMLLAGMQFSACKDDDELLTPSGSNDDFFSVPADAVGAEAEIRREFHKQTGIHLLFDEVLRSTVVGKDSQGEDIVKEEKIDFAWGLTSYDTYLEYECGHLTEAADQRKAADLFRQYILPHIQGSSISPYSVLLVNGLEKYNSTWDEYTPLVTLSCWRCLAVNVAGWIEAENDSEIAATTASICKDIVTAKFKYDSDGTGPFYVPGDEFYWEYITDYIDDWDRSDLSDLYSRGFITYYEHWSKPSRDEFPSMKNDFESYLNALFERTEDAFNAEFGDYPLVMEKYYLMKSLIEQTGYKF